MDPGIQVVKTAGNAADGQTEYLDGPAPVNVTYYFNVTNTSTTGTPLASVDLSDNICSGTETFTGGDTNTNTRLDVGETWTYTCAHTETDSGVTTNTATATGNPTDASGNDLPDVPDVSDTDQAVIDVFAPELEVTKQLNTTGTVYKNFPISFTIRITNTGERWISVLPLRDVYTATYLTYGYTDTTVFPQVSYWATPDSDNHNNDGEIEWADLLAASPPLAPGTPGDSISVDVWFTAKQDTTQAGLPNNETVNLAIVDSALADPDGPGPAPADKPVPPAQGSDGVVINTSTGVVLAGCQAAAGPHGVQVSWVTASEMKLLGFNVLRRLASDAAVGAVAGEFQAVNEAMLFGQHAGANQGASYSYRDPTVAAGRIYDYVLEVIQTDGEIVRYELPAVRTPQWFSLPLISTR